LEKSPSLQFSSCSPQLKLEKPSLPLIQVGMITKSSPAAHKDSFKSVTTVFNAPLPMSSMSLIKNADHAQLITYSTMSLNNATAESHANFQDNSTPTTSANAQLMKREPKESGTNQTDHATAQPTFPSGMENTVSPVQLELNLILRKSNAITAQKDLSETIVHTLVFQDFDLQIYTFIVVLLYFSLNF
jgi:hypothetical protein